MTFKFLPELSNSPQNVKTARWNGIELTVANENIEKPTVWEINENRHALIVHLGGTIEEIETEINRRASRLNPPTEGEFWLIPANAEYFTSTRGKTVSYAEFYFETDYLKKVCGEDFENYELAPQLGKFDNFIFQNIKKLTSLISKTDDISNLINENLSQAMCLHLFSEYSTNLLPNRKNPPAFSPQKFSLLQEYISDNLAEPITLKNLCEIAEMNSHKLLRFFNKSFGQTPAQYIIEQRLRKVRWLLANSKKDITTIAQETGFSSHSHLSSTFKSRNGISPNEFRSML